jgi:hypothetical protein
VVCSLNRELCTEVMHICLYICAYDLVQFTFVPIFRLAYVFSRIFSPVTFSAFFQSMAYMITVLKYHTLIILYCNMSGCQSGLLCFCVEHSVQITD